MFGHMITIIGGGPGGLVLARILHLRGVEFRVYESEATPDTRHQGGMLDLHVESGQAALRAAGLFEQFEARVLPGGDAMRVLDKTGTLRFAREGQGQRPEIGRGALRQLLLDSLPAGSIEWDCRVTEVRPAAGGGHRVAFANGRAITAERLVGADGAWSKVRPLVSTVVPEYLGLSFVEARLRDAGRRHQRQAALVGAGSLFALSDNKGILAHREPGDELSAYAAFRTATPWKASDRPSRAAVLEQFADWHEDLRDLIARSDGELVPRSIQALPTGHRWARVPGVTLVGDAAHLMSPFAGEGANLALLDGAELAAAIAAHPGDFTAALAQYEEPMFARSAEAAAESVQGLATCFTPTAPQELVNFFKSMPG